MCSISGIFSPSSISPDPVTRMNAAQRHRGPDDHGIFAAAGVVLGNTRLAIIDTSAAGHQPMLDAQTGNCVTYNGETYNFKDLRRELQGESWSSNTDTEVVLRAYQRWGVDAFGKLRGMFALAIWDARKRMLLLARDPLGIKPLYYQISKDHFIFASELRALLASGLAPRRLSAAGVDSYLANGSIQAPLTIVDGVKQLLPGHCLQVSANHAGTIETNEIEFATSTPARFDGDRGDAVARLRAELEESLRLHLVSDVPLGVFLSGGMDSSALVALMSRVTDRRPQTFSVVFDEARFTEAPFSRAVAERFNTDHSEIRLSEDRLIEILPEALAAIDQPTMDGVNTFVVSQAVKNEGVTVALSGLGGDELFAGYPSFRRALRLERMSPALRRVMRVAAGVGSVALSGSVQREKFRELAGSNFGAEDVYRVSRQLFSSDAATRMTGREANGHHANGNHGDRDTINTISRLELTGYMTNTLLRDTDAMSMAHSLEVRVPFVDVRVVDYVLSLPGEWKLRHGDGPKSLLSDAIGDLLPREFLKRPKMGFTLPFEKWLQGRMRRDVEEVLGDERRVAGVGLNGREVEEVWKRFLTRSRSIGWSRPWAIYVLVRWCESNSVS